MANEHEKPDIAHATRTFLPASDEGTVRGLPALIGACRIECEIGSGGMGVVLRGHDVDFGRMLAVKVLRGTGQDAGLVQRFLQEARITAQLQHPGIPPVHSVGKLDDGRPYFTMKLIQGRTLDVLLRQSTKCAADLPRFLAIFAQICQTLGYAHSQGVIHRDLKPANIMVGAFGEVQVMDWGLAKPLGGNPETPIQAGADTSHGDASTIWFTAASDTSLHTQAGNVLGTLAFMAPEQARGQVDQLDERCDVFGLGAILCVILTGKPPFTGSSRTQLHRTAAKGDLAAALERLDGCGADEALLRLTKACLSRTREDRPRNAGMVAEAMAAFQANIEKRLREAELERAAAEIEVREERKRRRLALGLAAAVLGLILLGAGGWTWTNWQQARREVETARVVNAAIQETTRLRGRAEAAPVGDVIPWREALGVVKRAEDLLASGAATPDLTQAVAQLRDELDAGLTKAEHAAAAADLDRNMLAWTHAVREEATELNQIGFNNAEVERAFADAFRKYGVDVDTLPGEEAARRIRGRPIQSELVAALDMWAWKRRCINKDRAGWDRLFTVARAVEPDPWRDRLRSAMAQNDANELARLAATADVAALPISVQVLLGDALFTVRRGEGGDFLRRAIQEHPRDFWINYYLGLNYTYFAKPPNYTEAARFYTAALVANDRSASVHANLAFALFLREGSLDEVIAEYEKAARLNPGYVSIYFGLGAAYEKKQLPDKAMDAYRKVIAMSRNRDTARAYRNLGKLLQQKGRTREAIDTLKSALTIRDQDPYKHAFLCHDYLGQCYHGERRWDEAITEYQQAIAIDQQRKLNSKYGPLHHRLGRALFAKRRFDEAVAAFKDAVDLKYEPAYPDYANMLLLRGRLDEAIAFYPKAIAVQPKNAQHRSNYGVALDKKDRMAEAIVAFEAALALEPSNPALEKNLLIALRKQGLLLKKQGRWEEAAAIFTRVLSHDTRDGKSQVELAGAYLNLGRFADAITAYRKAQDLNPAYKGTVASMVRSCEGLLELEKKLPAIAQGKVKLGAAEYIPFASLCRVKKLYGLCARVHADWLRDDPKLANDVAGAVRYDAACFAVLAAAGAGKDNPPLSEKERTQWRNQAHDWLRADLAVWSKLPKAGAAGLRGTLTHWRSDPDLMSVRDPDALARLPKQDRGAWQQLWRDVETLMDRQEKQHP